MKIILLPDNVEVKLTEPRIFPDDTINTALIKIAFGIADKLQRPELEQYMPYVWTKRSPIRYKNWLMPVNPMTINENEMRTQTQTQMRTQMPTTKAPVIYNNGLFGTYRILYVLFWSDANEAQKKIYFPDVPSYKIQVNREQLMTESKLFQQLFDASLPDSIALNINKKIYQQTVTQPIDCLSLFNILQTTNKVQFIQYVADKYSILYKLYKNHTIDPQTLTLLTTYSKIPKQRSGSFIKMLYGSSIIIIDSYSITARITADTITSITTFLQNKFNSSFRINLKPISLTGRFSLIQNKISYKISISDFAKGLSKFSNIFHVINIKDNVINIIYKRSINYKSDIDISDFISSRLNMGVSVDELIDDLMNLGLSKPEIDMWMSGQMTDQKKLIKNGGCLIRISNNLTGFRVDFEDISNFDELEYLQKWIFGTHNTIKPKPGDNVKQKQKPTQGVSVNVTESDSARKRERSPELKPVDSVLGEELDFGSDSFDGGAYQRYFLTELQNADQELFVNQIDNYPRKCAANMFQQPVVVTPEEKEKLDPATYDNAILYGTNPNKLHYYMCPRIWCPVSRVALKHDDPAKECPSGEEPILLYENDYWDNDPKKPHYISFINGKTKSGHCIPCCRIKPPTDTKLKGCVDPNQNQKQKEESPAKKDIYLINGIAPIDPNRYGNIPKDLHELLLPDISYALCSKTLSSQSCFIRKGIHQTAQNSFLKCIMSIFDYKSHSLFIKDFSKLTPMQFISSGVVSLFSEGSPKSKSTGLERAFEGMLYYFKSNLNIDPFILIPILEQIHSVNIVIVIKKENNESSVLHVNHTANTDKFVLILQDTNGIYEPVEYQMSKSQSTKVLSYQDFPVLSFNKKSYTKTVTDIIYLIRWIDTINLIQKSKFVIDKIVLRQDLQIIALVTKGNIWIHLVTPLDQIYLSDIIAVDSKITIVFHEDYLVSNPVLTATNIIHQDYSLFIDKLNSLDLHSSLGTADVSNGSGYFNATFTVPEVNKSIPPVLYKDSVYTDKIQKILLNKRKWFEIRQAVAKLILRKVSVKHVKEKLKHLPQKQLEVVLSEITGDPIKWANSINIEDIAYLVSLDTPIVSNKEIIFSQAAVENGAFKEKEIHTELKDNLPTTSLTTEPLTFEGDNFRKLPSKFYLKKDSPWSDKQIVDSPQDSPKIISMLSEYLKVPLEYSEIVFARSQAIIEVFGSRSKAPYELLFQDPGLSSVWLSHFKLKSIKTFDDLWKKTLEPLSFLEKRNTFKEIRTNITDLELDFYFAAKLLDINIIIIHRSVSGNAKNVDRGYTDDIKVSCTFFKAYNGHASGQTRASASASSWESKPLCILFREVGKRNYIFYPVVNEQKVFLHTIINQSLLSQLKQFGE